MRSTRLFFSVPVAVFVSLCALLSFSSCMNKASAQGAKAKKAQDTKAEFSQTEFSQTEQKDAAPVASPNPEVEKLGRVLASMSRRAKDVIPNGDPAEFLSDLHAVLDADKKGRSDDLSLLYLIDKKHNVGPSYVPKDLVGLVKNDLYTISRNNLSLRPEAEASLREMSAAALKDGIRIHVLSTYRSYEYQKNLFQYWVKVDGLAEAERESAREGTSQHQLGTAVDFGELSNGFASTPMGKWLYTHAQEYGWSLSFPQEYEDVTGFRWESWHFRYIGKEACRFQKKWFGDVQQFMIEFVDAWKTAE